MIPIIGQNAGGQNQKVQLNPRDLETMKCRDEACGHNIFSKAFVMKRLSPLQDPNGQGGLIPIEMMICDKCRLPFIEEL